MQSTSWETLGWKKHKLESRFPGEISISSDMKMTPPLWHHPFPYERAEWKSWLKTQHSENMASDPITSWQVDGETMEMVKDFILGGSKITSDGDCSHEIKIRLLLGIKVMINLDSILKSRDTTLPTKVHLVKAMVFPVVTYGCESWTKESWATKDLMLEKTLESPLDCKEIQAVHCKGNQPWIFIGRTDAETETPILWHLIRITDSFEKTLMLGKIEGRRRRGW